MTWTETHARWAAVHEIEVISATDLTGELPWTERYAEIFGNRDSLLTALRYHVTLASQAQLDTHLPEAELDERRRDLLERFAGVRRILRRYAAGTFSTPDQPFPGEHLVGA